MPNASAMKLLTDHEESISKKADSTLKIIHHRLQSPAVSIAVGQHDKIIWANAIGYQNIEDQTPVDLETKFRIGSTSKAVTSLGIGVLLQNKKINLDSKVKDFVPYAKEHLSNITLKQLASHTSGIRNYGTCLCFPVWEYYSNDEYTNVQESVGVFNNDDLLFDPGSDFGYSSFNYTLLSAMIEGASKMTFPDFMKQYVFDPLNAVNIVAETSALPKNTSRFYEVAENTYQEVYKVNNSNKWAGGGLLATPTDLVKIGNAFLNHQLFDSKITQELTKPVRLDNGEINEQEYAIGWRNHTKDIFGNGQKINIWHHGGIANGSISLLVLFPKYNLSISMLANKNGSSADLFENVYDIARLYINQSGT
ncbi:hypothetical protein GCM10022258_45360 [Aquimarina gracilis]